MIDNKNRENRLKPWLAKVGQKETNHHELKLQENRIQILERRNYKQIIGDQQEYTKGMTEEER